MRIGTLPDCSWYRADARHFTVTFNGVVIQPQLLILADDETGLLVTRKIGDPEISVIEHGEVMIWEPAHVVEEVPFQ